MFGFTLKDWGDHELARYLRKQNAIDNYVKSNNCNMWYNENNTCVAVVFYIGTCGYKVYIKNNYKESNNAQQI